MRVYPAPPCTESYVCAGVYSPLNRAPTHTRMCNGGMSVRTLRGAGERRGRPAAGRPPACHREQTQSDLPAHETFTGSGVSAPARAPDARGHRDPRALGRRTAPPFAPTDPGVRKAPALAPPRISPPTTRVRKATGTSTHRGPPASPPRSVPFPLAGALHRGRFRLEPPATALPPSPCSTLALGTPPTPISAP